LFDPNKNLWMEVRMSSYARPDSIVETEWVAAHLSDPLVRVVESDEDALLYDTGHIPGAVRVDWFTTLQDKVRRDFLSQAEFEELCRSLGISNDTTVVFYGDKSNWFAVYAFWLFTYYGHAQSKVMNGGRLKWVSEGRPLTGEIPAVPAVQYQAKTPDSTIRAFREDVFRQVDRGLPMVDVRSPKEYSGELLAMPGYPQEGAQRAGHIPGAVNIPWAQAVQEDGTFKPVAALQEIYTANGVTPDQEVITYCRIGERSSHTWFVLHYLLGYPRVRNYDGSWTEWGNLVSAPIRKGPQP
jgi:thiosulfate/3-mercaptopyruvate sulfurtransferase